MSVPGCSGHLLRQNCNGEVLKQDERKIKRTFIARITAITMPSVLSIRFRASLICLCNYFQDMQHKIKEQFRGVPDEFMTSDLSLKAKVSHWTISYLPPLAFLVSNLDSLSFALDSSIGLHIVEK